ncbi:Histone-lysine N-methyltransferase prdm9 [Mactra antiquata]
MATCGTKSPSWCEECGKSHEGMCKKHGILHTVQDAVIPSRARLTLPSSLTLKTVKENGQVYTGVFSKRTIPVRSRFGPLDAPVISRVKHDVKTKREPTVWKKKNAMQKALENSTHNIETSDLSQSGNDAHSPVIPNRNLQPKVNNSIGAETAISSIQQQLMSITSQSINNQGLGDSGLLLLQPGLNQIPMQSSPVNHHTNLNQLQQSLQDLPPISFPNTCTPGGLQFTQESLQSLAHHYHNTYGSDLSSVHQNVNLTDFVTHPQMHQPMGTDQSATSLLMTPLVQEGHNPGDDSGVVDASNMNTSDSTATDATSDNELDESIDQDMSFELKVATDDGFVELLDTADEDHANWMIFVRPATNVKEQNLIAYQEDGQIYFVSLKPITTNTELKVWYCKDYAKSLHKGMLAVEVPGRQGIVFYIKVILPYVWK